jgi:hypothetical protein
VQNGIGQARRRSVGASVGVETVIGGYCVDGADDVWKGGRRRCGHPWTAVCGLECQCEGRGGEVRRTRGVDGRGSVRNSKNLTIGHLIMTGTGYGFLRPCWRGAFVISGRVARVSFCASGEDGGVEHDVRVVYQDTPHEGWWGRGAWVISYE